MRTAALALQRSRRVRFEKLVDRVLLTLDPAIQRALDNVSVVVEDLPPDGAHDQFGNYDGIPKSERGSGYSFAVPDRIVIYRIPLEEAYSDQRELADQVRITVLHEIGHHLGLDEDRLDLIGLA